MYQPHGSTFYRTGQPQHQSPDSTHPAQPEQLPPLQSLDVDFSQQQPGPSGLHLLSPPTHSQGPTDLSSSSRSSGAGGQTVPEPSSGGNATDVDQSSPGNSLYPPRPVIPLQPGVFHIPLSQDLLASTQDISTGFSQTREYKHNILQGVSSLRSLTPNRRLNSTPVPSI